MAATSVKSKELLARKQQALYSQATGHFKSIGFMAFMMWMSGNSLHLFSIMTTASGIYQPLMAIVNCTQGETYLLTVAALAFSHLSHPSDADFILMTMLQPAFCNCISFSPAQYSQYQSHTGRSVILLLDLAPCCVSIPALLTFLNRSMSCIISCLAAK